jgi:hypothetical protein
MTLTRAAALGLAALAGFAAVVITVPGQSSGATAYRYWAFYLGHGSSWQYASRGPATEYPVDGDVEGWRFAIQADAASGLLPGLPPDFAALCASSPPKAGELRVGVVIDFGLATDAPAKERPPAGVVPGCVYVHDGATDMDALAAAATIRIGTGSYVGLVCGIDGYPKTECAVAAATHSAAPPAPTPTPQAVNTTITSSQPTPKARTSSPGASVSSAATVSPSAAVQSTVVPVQPLASAQPSAAARSSANATAQAAPATSLSALRSSARRGHGAAAGTIAGIALIVILGGGAVWRTRVRGR